MGKLVIPDVSDETIAVYESRARRNNRSLVEEVRELLERHRTPTPQERVAVARSFLDKFTEPLPPMSLDEIREGLE